MTGESGVNVDQTFLSTPSARRATRAYSTHSKAHPISIHALREEGDKDPFQGTLTKCKFLSTPSARRATCGIMQIVKEV